MNELEIARLALYLRITYAIAFLGSGVDKFFCRITNWYKQGMTRNRLHLRGGLEILIGIGLLSPWVEYAAYTAALWLVASGLMLLPQQEHRDTACRYAVIGLGVYTLARLIHIQR